MGREVKRVPLDLDHPVGEIWPGYEPPEVRDCPNPDCRIGVTTGRKRLAEVVSLLLLSGGDAARDKSHPYFQRGGFYQTAGISPTKDLAELTEGLTGRSPRQLLGHDASDRWAATKKIIEAAGLDPESWGICTTCHGSGLHPEDQGLQREWEREDPPEGEGWQVWETTSEGSPITPVFGSPEELAQYCAEEGVSVVGSRTADEETWLRFIREGWAPTMVHTPEGGLQSGVEATP